MVIPFESISKGIRIDFLADELMFIFGEPLNLTDDLQYTEEEILMSEKLMNYWANFAKYE